MGRAPEPTLYLFDGYNLLHAGAFADARELRDALASFVALKGASGVVVFDGAGVDERHGRLEVRYAPDADAALERIAAARRDTDVVCLVSSDFAIRGTAGQEVRTISSRVFAADLEVPTHADPGRGSVRDRLDDETKARLERLRRGRG